MQQDCGENDEYKEGAKADFYCFGGWEEVIPYASLPHGHGYFSDPVYGNMNINPGAGGGGGAGGGAFSEYNAYQEVCAGVTKSKLQ